MQDFLRLNDAQLNRRRLLKFQFAFFRALSLSVWAVAIQGVMNPKMFLREYHPHPFPETLQIESFQDLTHTTLAVKNTTTPQYDRILATRQYDYTYQQKPLSLELRYVVDTEGDLGKLMDEQMGLPKEINDTAKMLVNSIGTYRSFTYQKRAYVSTCLTPTGRAVINKTQFQKQQYLHLLEPKVWGRWAIGQGNLLEQRCIWAQISMPIQQAHPSAEESALLLKQIGYVKETCNFCKRQPANLGQ
ncbi:cyanoexosortase A system-associated protein [Alkalinema sp. FACHB-956]|uniref:cyanoexosortase A system-associated protein n=1 Tax=Alkalinema sp. FACHB-956 TaxID=2692768 RepID=UPI0016854521|nr:cyanoexosortase A system-associated protein [Alkalinema sp. FACHB-956]